MGEARVKGSLHIFRSQKDGIVYVHQVIEILLFCLREDSVPGRIRAQLVPQPVQQPHAHDVLLVAGVAHAAFIGVVGGHAARRLPARRQEREHKPAQGDIHDQNRHLEGNVIQRTDIFGFDLDGVACTVPADENQHEETVLLKE